MRQTILSNGATIATQPVAGARTAMIALQMAGGARAQQRHEAGFAHLVEHVLMTPSAPTMGGAANQAALFAQLGGEVNGYTGREHVALVGHTTTADAARLAAHFADRILRVQFDDAVLREETARIEQESALNAQAAGNMEAVLFNCLWPEHPLNNPLFPDSGAIAAANPTALQAFWRRICNGPGTSLLAVGAVDHDVIVTSAAQIDLLSAAPLAVSGAPLHLGGGGVRRFPPLSAGADGKLIWILPSDGADACAEFLLHLLCGTQQGELYRVLRDGGLHQYGLDVVHLRFSDAAVMAFAIATTARSHDATRTLVESHLSGMARDGIGATRFEVHRASLETRRVLDASRLDYHLEQLALGIQAGEESEEGGMSPDVFARWLSHAWAARVVLDWPPGASCAP